MVLQYDENVRNLLYRRSCQYTQSGLVDASVLEADLVERVKSFAKRYPNSRTAQACKAVEGCTPDAIAEAIRSTCQQARRELLQEAMTGWSDASREWFMQQIEEAKKEKVETYTASAGNEVTSFISMTLLGISSVYVNDEEKLKKKFEEIGLIVDSVQESKAIMWKAPYRPEIASAEEIPVTVSFLRNAQAEKLWQGREDFAIDGRKFTAVHVSIVHDRSFKIRAKRGPWGKGGSLAELTHLLTLGGMTTAEIAAVYRYQLLRQSLAAVQLQPLAGMLVAGAPGQQVHKGLGQKGFVAVGANVIWRQREVEWIVSSSCPEANDTAFRAFRESEAMEGVHLTLFSEDPKIREALAVELTADRFVSRNKLKKASRMQKKAGGKDGKEIKIIIKSTAASGRFTRKEMEGLCNGGNTSIARVKRVLLEIANRLEINVEGIDMEEDLNTKSWNGSKLCILLGSTEDARRMMKELPFYLEGAATKLEAVGFDKEPDSEAAGQRGTSDAAQRQEESEGEWLEFTDLERITMEAASPSSQEDMQLVSELSAVIEDAASLNEAGTSEPIKLVLDKAVGNLHDTFYSPGSLEFMALGEWAKMPEEQGVGRNALKEKLGKWLQSKRWTRVQGESKKARRGSAFSPRATAAAELEQEAESDDIERTSEPIKLVLDKAVGNLHDTFYSPGSLEFMALGEWAKMPEEQGVGRNALKEKLGKWLQSKRWTRVQGESKKARRGSAFSPRATAAAELEQEAESDDIERRSLSLLFIALSKFAEMHVLACSLKVDKKDRLRVEMREDDEEEEDMEEEQGEGEEEDGASPYRA
ncbi:hypothetical protein GUITHDRAFT_120621 [Guillardia theta CCMP2712]|uniref:Uncharacterized protein n=1 Tax=Guillardia theta (strain CCMP2712) TaxID=905079 RepID=L1IAD0_GUITC|nr:hypothetical protein GUITHDRAFT_120621 [Guillardia theta CCMP2712]EKX33221.1 hypothetical protein GUITHDRAFT_120621 [Guillardia theta CCMP2712]|eukprot:XP_005820201.1 hypothetical protein GUITHDRAFT_120621 [Guillardia theta CCMP2712]